MDNHSRVDRWSRWLSLWFCVSLPGLCAAVLVWGPVQATGIATAVAIPVVLILLTLRHGYPQWPGLPRSRTFGLLFRLIVGGPAFVLSTAMVNAVAPGVGIVMVAAAIVTSPSGIDAAQRLMAAAPWSRTPQNTRQDPTTRHARHGAGHHDGYRAMPAVPLQSVHDMTAAELRIAWRDTFWALREFADPASKLAAVSLRECFLDELEFRDPAAFGAWLASDARPSTIPPGLLRGNDDDDPTAP